MQAEPRIDTRWSLDGLAAVIMENSALRAVALPALGGKLLSVVDKRSDSELLWQNPRLPVRMPAFGSDYDDQFIGGWDEIFPNDIPEVLAGDLMPDHGELWSVPWTASTGTTDGSAWLELRVVGPVTGIEAVKKISLGDSARLIVDYRVRNPTRRALPFLWKAHVAVALDSDTVIDLADSRVCIEDFGMPRARPIGDRFDWPTATVGGVTHDFRRLPDTSDRPVSEFLLATDLGSGRCGVRHPACGTGLQLTWDRDALPVCWLFGSYGGAWRGLNVLVLEPCTGHPVSVVDGAAVGSHLVLDPGATLTWTITAELTTGARPHPGPTTC